MFIYHVLIVHEHMYESLPSHLVWWCCTVQGVCARSGARQHRLDPDRPRVTGQSAVRLHHDRLQLPAAANLRRLPAGSLLEENQRKGRYSCCYICAFL